MRDGVAALADAIQKKTRRGARGRRWGAGARPNRMGGCLKKRKDLTEGPRPSAAEREV